jgi:hypothetical protein
MSDSPRLPSASDFPAGTVFYIKEWDVPLVHLPGNTWVNWYGGKPRVYDTSALRVDNNIQAKSFEEWLGVVRDSLPAT